MRLNTALSLVRLGRRQNPRPNLHQCYLISTFAPASSSFFFAASASALLAPSRTGLGAPSTRALASAKPRPALTSRTALMAAIFLSGGTETKMTSKAVFASAAGAAAAPAPAGAAAAAGAAAVTPQAVSSCLTKSAASITVNLPNCSTNPDISAIFPFSLVAARSRGRILLASPRADDLLCSCCLLHLHCFDGNEIV